MNPIQLHDQAGVRKYLNLAERRAVAAAAQSVVDPQRRAFVLTLLHTGARPSELLQMTTARIDEPEHSVIIRTLKQRGSIKYRTIPIPRDLLRLLAEITKGKNDDELIWECARSTMYLTVKSVMISAGLDGIKATSKGLRHAFAVACVLSNIPLTTIQKWMGHSRLETTSIYLQISGAEELQLARKLWKSTL